MSGLEGMDEAHRRDYEHQKHLRNARWYLTDLAKSPKVGDKLTEDLLALAERLKREEDHIVARWN